MVGADFFGYYWARSFYEQYGIKPYIIGNFKAGKYKNPIYYPADKGLKRRIMMRLRDINYFRKYKNNPLHEKV